MIYFMSQTISKPALQIAAAFDLTDVHYYGSENNLLSNYLIGIREKDDVHLKLSWNTRGVPSDVSNVKASFEFSHNLDTGMQILSQLTLPFFRTYLPEIDPTRNYVLSGLYSLGYDIEELEKTWNTYLTSHEKLEAQLNYRKRFEKILYEHLPHS